MNHINLKFSGLLFCFFLLISCKNDTGKETTNITDLTDLTDLTDFKKLCQDWNKAHSSKDVGVFSNLYDDSILFYGTRQDKNTCIESKLTFFKKFPDFYQQIHGGIQIENLDNEEVKCSFVKRITVSGTTTDYPSYLILKKLGEGWRIVIESDLVTDGNLSKSKIVNSDIPKDAKKGDFNGDGILDYMWLVKPKIDAEGTDCIGNCISYIKFSDSSIPSIEVSDCIGGVPTNKGDLNKNGGDEIGLLPDWFIGYWQDYHVWTLLNGKWVNAVEPFSTHWNQWEEGVKPIEIDLNREGYVIIRYSEFTNEGLGTKSKSVRIIK